MEQYFETYILLFFAFPLRFPDYVHALRDNALDNVIACGKTLERITVRRRKEENRGHEGR